MFARTLALKLQIGLYVSRVPSKDNLSDDPSRERYTLMKALKAERIDPVIHKMFKQAQTWEALQLCCLHVAKKPKLGIKIEDDEPVDLATGGA